jgi:N-acetylmuramoyl-L-alanine amidase
MNKPMAVILHCAATPDYAEDSPYFDRFGATDIDHWHKARGFAGIGYHWVIRRTGLIEPGREESEIGAHTKGHNTNTIGICYIGTAKPTQAQLNAICDGLYVQIKKRHGIGSDRWFGHHEFNSGKDCPGFNMVIFRKLLSYRDLLP